MVGPVFAVGVSPELITNKIGEVESVCHPFRPDSKSVSQGVGAGVGPGVGGVGGRSCSPQRWSSTAMSSREMSPGQGAWCGVSKEFDCADVG